MNQHPRGELFFEIFGNSFAQNLDLVGDILWSVAYVLLIIIAFRTKRPGIPAIAICLNFTWEIAFTLVHEPTGIRLYTQLFWLVLDAIIVFQLFLYANRPPLAKWHFNVVFAVGLLMSYVGQIIYLQMHIKTDPSGSFLAYVINLTMAGAFVMMFFDRKNDPWSGLDVAVAWTKMLGTGVITVSVYLQCRENMAPYRLFLYLGFCTAIVDCYYIYLIHWARGRSAAKTDVAIAGSTN